MTTESNTNHAARRLGIAWLALTGAVAVHVWDEAANDFLSVYNPTVTALRERLGWFPMPNFTYDVWLNGLIFGVGMLAVLSLGAFAGWRGMRWLAYGYGTLMLLNAAAHLVLPLVAGRFIPGVYSAPLLLAASVWLLICARHWVRQP